MNATSSLSFKATLDDCEVSWDNFRESAASFIDSQDDIRPLSTYVKTYSTEITQTEYSTILYTLEDGYPRVSTQFPIRTYVDTFTGSFNSTIWSNISSYTASPPPCYDKRCEGWCFIFAPRAQLNYWPASTIADKANLTLPPNATEPQTAVVDGITFTSPTVYIVYDTVFTTGGCESANVQHTHAVVGLRSEDVSIARGYHNYLSPERLNFSDFQGPVPFKCNRLPEENCLPIPTVYNPLLVIPEKIRDLDPAWKNCRIENAFGTADPPRLLVPAKALVGSTSAIDADVTSAAAVPAPTVLTPGAASTMKPNLANPSPTRLPVNGLNPQNPPAETPSAKNPPAQDAHKHPLSKDLNEDPFNVDGDVRSLFVNENSIFLKLPPSSAGEAPTTISGEVFSVGINGITFGDKTIPFSAFQQVSTSARQAASNAAAGLGPATATATNFAELFEIVNGQPLHRADVLIPTPSITGFASIYQSVAAASLTPHPVITFGSQHYSANVAGEYIIEGQTLGSGSTITIAGTVISAPAAQALPSTPNFPAIVIGSKSFTANSVGQYVIAGQTLSPGGTITISGTAISAPNSPPSMSISGAAFPTIVINSQTLTANLAGQYVIAGQTLSPGGIITVSGTVISAPTFPPRSTPILPALILGSQTLTANPAGQYLIAGQTLSPGGIITVSGTVISAPTFPPRSTPILPALVLGSQTLTANPAGQYLIAGQTLIPGGTIRLSGQPVILLAPSATALVLGSVTEALVSPTRGVGAWIMEGLAGGSSSSSGVSGAGSTPSFTGMAYEGVATPRRVRSSAWMMAGGALVLGLVWI